MAPIPTKQKRKPQQPQTVNVPTSDVYDEFGRPLDLLMRKQTRTDRSQSNNITINRQHAQQYESDKKNKLIYRDVFPGRKYKLTLSDVSWLTGQNTLTIGYTVGDTFTSINYDQDGNDFEFELPDASSSPSVPLIDTVEVRMTGVTTEIRGYMSDNTDSKSLWAKIAEMLLDISDLKDRMSSVEGDISDIKGDITSLDDRVTALEQAQ